MVVQLLNIACELENVQHLRIPEDHEFVLDIEVGPGEIRRGVIFSRENQVDIPSSRGTANLVLKIDKNSFASLSVCDLPKTIRPELCASDSEKLVPILAIECRGCEVKAWKPTGFYVAQSTQGAIFEEVDLSTGEWYDVDAEANEPVSITNVRTSIEPHRK